MTMAGYAILIWLDELGKIREVRFSPQYKTTRLYQLAGSLKGVHLKDIPHFKLDLDKNSLVFDGISFVCFQVNEKDGTLLVVQEENLRERLLLELADHMTEAIQLYDQNGVIQFFNLSAKRMLGISAGDDVRGQRLQDVFAVDPQYSTTLTTLSTGSPVLERYDSYKSTTGKELLTVNDGWPVFSSAGSIQGAVVREQNMEMIKEQLARLQNDQQLLTRQVTDQFPTRPQTRYTFEDIIGSSAAIQGAVQLAKQMALKEMNILLQGETGSGKEMFAQGIHAFSSRKKEKFLAVNCAAFPESLIESMLFGTVKGAFTDSQNQIGLLEAANHGTLFLDEMNSMSLAMQAKLLRVLQEKKVQRIGSSREIPLDVRIISSCNEDPFQLMEQGKLRRDLFYRLGSVIIEIPPLRDRMEDMGELVNVYLQKHQAEQPIHAITPRFWQLLRQHDWPGNVRELFHILSYALSVSKNGILDVDDFPSYFLRHQHVPKKTAANPKENVEIGKGLSQLVQEYEYRILMDAYRQCGWNATKAAELLQLSRQNFQYYMRKYHLTRKKEK